MSTPIAEDALERDHKCQTPDCGNRVAVVIIRMDDLSADGLCDSCNLAMWLAVLQQAAEQGTITLDAPPPEGDAVTQQ